MAKIRRPGKLIEYTLEEDRGSENPTVFVLRPLTWRNMLDLQSDGAAIADPRAMRFAGLVQKAQSEGREQTAEELEEMGQDLRKAELSWFKDLTQFYANAVRLGLEKIKGLVDDDGRALDIKVPDFIEHASPAMLIELGRAILEASKFDEGAKKNSAAPPAPGRPVTDAASAH